MAASSLACRAGPGTHHGDGNPGSPIWFAADSSVIGWWGAPGLTPTLVIVGYEGGLVAFRRSDGALAWRTQLWTTHYRAGGANVAVEDSTACLDDMETAGCVDVRTGRRLWQVSVPSAANPGQTVLERGVWFYGTAAHELFAVDARTGAEHWHRNIIPGAKFTSVIWGVSLAGDTLYAATREWHSDTGVPSVGAIVALSATSGATFWRYETTARRGGFMGAPVVTPTLVVGNDVDGHALRAIRRVDGTEAWASAKRADGFITAEAAPIVVGDTVFSASDDTQMHALDLATGRTLWQQVVSGNALQYTAACGAYLLTTNFAGGPLFLIAHDTHAVVKASVPEPGDEVESRFAVDGATAYFASKRGVYRVRCGE